MKTTIKVDAETRDLVREVSRERHLEFDETIRLGMAALQRDARRTKLREQSRAAAADPADLAEAASVLADMEAWDAR